MVAYLDLRDACNRHNAANANAPAVCAILDADEAAVLATGQSCPTCGMPLTGTVADDHPPECDCEPDAPPLPDPPSDPCPDCDGAGTFFMPTIAGFSPDWYDCERCAGTGRLDPEERRPVAVTCYDCGHSWDDVHWLNPCPNCGALPKMADDEPEPDHLTACPDCDCPPPIDAPIWYSCVWCGHCGDSGPGCPACGHLMDEISGPDEPEDVACLAEARFGLEEARDLLDSLEMTGFDAEVRVTVRAHLTRAISVMP